MQIQFRSQASPLNIMQAMIVNRIMVMYVRRTCSSYRTVVRVVMYAQ